MLRSFKASRVRTTVALGVIAVAASWLVVAASASAWGFIVHGSHKFSLSGGSATFTAVNGFSYGCSASGGEGEDQPIGETITVSLRFTGCHLGGISCTSSGAEKGEIRALPIPAQLRYTNLKAHEVGLVLNPKGGTIASWSCSALYPHEGIQGTIVAPITPTNTETTSFNLSLTQKGTGIQSPSYYYGPELEEVPNVFPAVRLGTNPITEKPWTQGSLQASLTMSTEENWVAPGF